MTYKSIRELTKYISKSHWETVDGWVSLGAFIALKLFADYQQNTKIKGAICEIGVYHGKFFIGMCGILNKSEKAIAIDIFENKNLNITRSGEDDGDLNVFKRNLKTFNCLNDNIVIIHSDSMSLNSNDILEILDGDRIRLFSIDGCHSAPHTANDLNIAQETIASGGIIMIDDFYNPHLPGVAEGVHRFFNLSPIIKVKPFAYGDNKLYLTTHSHYQQYIDLINSFPFARVKEEKILWGNKVLYLSLTEKQSDDIIHW
jgi:hypothetical protein